MADYFLPPLEELKCRQGWYAKRPSLRKSKDDPIPLHEGFDFACKTGTPVLSIATGIIRIANYGSPTAGNWVTVGHLGDAKGFGSRYLHLSKLYVKAGEKVEAGQVLGLSGSTGLSTGPHLHFDIQASQEKAEALRLRGLKEVGRQAPGAALRRNIPVEQMIRKVFEEKHGQHGASWTPFLGEIV